jgi:hypothetical protein
MNEIRGALEARKEAGDYRRPAKYRIGIAFVIEVNDDADVIDITPLKED